MAEYIDKNATVGILEAMSRSADCECIKKRLEKAAKRVSAIPAADVVPVVRCKDCKHYDIGGSCIICGFQSRKPDDFCSYGERKEGAE
jgi:hypothetical protein